MAVVRISDAVVPAVYLTYTALNSPELTAFWQAGIIANNPILNSIAKNGGKLATLPWWGDLDATIEPNMSNDDPADLATPEKLGSGQMQCRKAFMNKSFASMDLVMELAGSDPMVQIRNRFGTYWMRQWQRRLIATTVGMYNTNVAKNAGDMVVNISAGTGAAAVFNSDAVLDASQTMGDAGGQFVAIAVHSMIRTRMLKDDDIEFIKDSDGKLVMELYKGMRVIVDDSMPILSGTGTDRVYLSVMFRTGAFGFGTADGSCFAYGEGDPAVPVEVDRTPAAGNGGGMEALWERKTQILHPQGFTWIEDVTPAMVEFSPVLADLRLATHWARVVDRKQAPFAFLVSKA